MSIKDYKITSIKPSETHEWILYKHYAKRIPSISYAFGLYNDKTLVCKWCWGLNDVSLVEIFDGKLNPKSFYEY